MPQLLLLMDFFGKAAVNVYARLSVHPHNRLFSRVYIDEAGTNLIAYVLCRMMYQILI